MNNPIFDTCEFYDELLGAQLRANVLGGGINERGVYLIVQPTEAELSGEWAKFPTDDTAFKVSADVVVGTETCPRCNGVGHTAIRNGDDDIPCPSCS